MNALLDALLQLLALGVLSLGGFAIHRLGGWLGLRQDSEIRAYLNDALARAVDLAENEARARLPTYAKPSPAEVERLVGRAAEYTRSRVPGALDHFKIGPQDLRDIVRARIAARPAALPDVNSAS